MTVSLMPLPKQAFFSVDSSGRQRPLVGGKVYVYAAGTTTPRTTYTDSTGNTANTWPVVLDSRGEASIWLGPGNHKIKLTTSGGTEIWTVDGVSGASQYSVYSTMADLRLASGVFNGQTALLLGYYAAGDGGGNAFYWDSSSTATDNGGTVIQATGVTTGRWIAQNRYEQINVIRFGAYRTAQTDANKITATTAAIQAALTEQGALQAIGSGTGGGRGTVPQVIFPSGVYTINDELEIQSSYTNILGDDAVLSAAASFTAGSALRSRSTGTANGWRVTVTGLQFENFETGIYFDSANTNSGRVIISRCGFFAASSWALHIDCQSSTVTIEDCVFRSNVRELYVEAGDVVIMRGGWISRGVLASDGSQGTAGIHNYGYLRMENVLGVPTTQAIAEPAWVDNYGEFWAHQVRFGGESGSHSAVNNYAEADLSSPITPNHVTLTQCDCYNTFGDNSTIRLFELPNAIRVLNCNGFPDQNYIRWSSTRDAAAQNSRIATVDTYARAYDYFRIDVSGNCTGFDPPDLATEPMVPANLQKYARVRMAWGANIAAGYKLGIGIDDPAAEIDIRSADGLTSRVRLGNDGNTLAVGDQLGRLEFFSGDNSGAGADTVVAGVVGRQAATTPSAGYLAFQADDGTDRLEVWDTAVLPTVDNSMTLGDGTHRFTVVYATTGTINTSDRNQKNSIAMLTDAERELGRILRGLLCTFKYNGNDKKSVGIIAQDVMDAFATVGLDWRDYDVVTESAGVYGVRYDGLMALIIGGFV